MITFILPGYSARNKDWAEEVAKKLKVEGQIRPVFWDHWTSPEKALRPRQKAELIARHSKGETISMVAKSVGTFVAAYVVSMIPERIGKIILCGIPSVSDERLKVFKEAFAEFPAGKVICFQNERDPFKNPSDIRAFWAKINKKIKVNAMPRSDHHYPYYEEFNKFLLG